MNRSARCLLFAAALAACTSLAPSARAQGGAAPTAKDAPTADGNRAVALAKEGRAAYEAQRFDEAYDKFAAANELVPSPPFELYMARARRGAGRLVEARTIYLRITEKELGADAPAVWKQADADARAELSALAAQLPSIVIEAHGAPDDAKLALDGREVRAGESIDVDPGEHVATLTQGSRVLRGTATVRAGMRGVPLKLVWDGAAAPEGGPTSAPEAEGRPGSIVPGVVGLAVGGALLGAGAIFGALALSTDGDVVDACPEGACGAGVDVASVQSDQDSAGTLADVSTVMLIAGGVVATAGVVLLVVRPGGDDGPATTAVIAPGGLVVRGGF